MNDQQTQNMTTAEQRLMSQINELNNTVTWQATQMRSLSEQARYWADKYGELGQQFVVVSRELGNIRTQMEMQRADVGKTAVEGSAAVGGHIPPAHTTRPPRPRPFVEQETVRQVIEAAGHGAAAPAQNEVPCDTAAEPEGPADQA